jgi:DNA-binding LacI/PurR family transcriptional regulator
MDPKVKRLAQRSSRGVLIYPQVRDSILNELEKHKYSPGTRLPTDVEYAKVLNVDRLTVSRALNELARQGRVVRRRGAGTFVADSLRPPLIMNRHLRIGVLFPVEVLPDTIATKFEGHVLRGLLEHWGLGCATANYYQGGPNDPTHATWTLRERGVTVEAVGCSPMSGQSHPQIEAILTGKYDALISLGIVVDEWLDTLLQLNIPVVLVDYPGDRFVDRADSIYVDALSGYRRAVAWLVAQGYKRIHFLGYMIAMSPPDETLSEEEARQYRSTHKRHDPDSLLRAHAFRVAMEECGRPVQEHCVHILSNKKTQFEDMSAHLLSLPEQDRPEVLVAASLEHAHFIMEAFKQRELPLLAVGTHTSNVNNTNMMSIRVDCAALGEAAGTLVLSRLMNPDRPNLRVGVNLTFRPEPAAQNLVSTESKVPLPS